MNVPPLHPSRQHHRYPRLSLKVLNLVYSFTLGVYLLRLRLSSRGVLVLGYVGLFVYSKTLGCFDLCLRLNSRGLFGHVGSFVYLMTLRYFYRRPRLSPKGVLGHVGSFVYSKALDLNHHPGVYPKELYCHSIFISQNLIK